MGRKKSKNQPSSDAHVGGNVNGDSSDSNEKNASTVSCNHIAKSTDFNQIFKALKNGENLTKNFCSICLKESKGLKGSDLFICLKCGTKTCCKEHSKAHFDVPRSDLHSLAFDYTSKTLWCYSCASEINERDAKNKKLSGCISTLNRRLALFDAKKNPSSAEVGDKTEIIADNAIAPRFQNGKKGKQLQQKNKHGSTNQCRTLTSTMPVRGLSNLGNTCYFNSVMQCLARTQPLLMELKEMDNRGDVRIELKGGDTLEGCLEKWDPMSECLYETLTALLAGGSVFVPSKFLGFVRKKHPQFEGYDQHDAHELLRHTLDSIKMNDLRRYRRLMLAKKGLSGKVDPTSVPQQMQKQLKELEHKVTQVQNFIPEKTFKGKLVSRVECQDCNHSSEYIEGFLDLSLPVLADKPHPPVARRKTGCASEHLYDDKSTYKMSPKQKRMMKRAANDELKRLRKELGDCNEVADDDLAIETREVLADPPDGTLGMDEDKPHESGYSSEKASSSLRGSPSSEEVRSSSPCDDSWSTVPQFTDSWLSSIPGGIQLPIQGAGDVTPNLVNRPPTHIPLRSDGTPDLAHLSLHDSIGSTLSLLCQDTLTIMEREPDWRNRIHQRYFNTSLMNELTENNERIARNEDDSQDLGTPELDNSTASHVQSEAASLDVPLIPSDKFVQEEQRLGGVSDSGDRPAASSVNETTVSQDANRSVSPPFRRNVQMRSQVKRDSGFSPVREEESECLAEQALLDSIQETYLEKPDSNLDPQKLPPNEAIEEWYRTKLEESQALRELPEDAKQANFAEVSSLCDLGPIPLRFGCTSFDLTDDNSESSDWSSPLKTSRSPNNGDRCLRDHIVQTAPNNSSDSEGNETGNEKSMNTCSEEFPDELLPEDQMISEEAKEALPDNLLETTEERDFKPHLDSVPSNSKLSIAYSNVDKNEPELHELCDQLRIEDDDTSPSKPDVTDRLIPDCRANFSEVSSLCDLGSIPLRFGCTSLDLADYNSESSDWSSPHKTSSSPKNGDRCLRDHIVQTAPNNSSDSEGNATGNEKSMNTCSEEFPDELLPKGSSEYHLNNSIGANSTIRICDQMISEEAKAALPDNLLETTEEGDFEPLLDSLPSNSKLSIAHADVDKNEPELHELCGQLRIKDDDTSPSKPDVPDRLIPECRNETKNEIASLIQKRDTSKDSYECSVESCLRQFTAIEFMTGSNKVGCSACTERQNKGAKDGKTVFTMATKQLLIGQAPPVLILHLKRFQVQLHSFRKLSKHVSYPLVLDLGPFCTSIGEDKNKVDNDNPMPYLLYGIVEHRGTLNSGHYVAYVKTGEGNDRRWFCISDSHVNEVTEERALKTEAYLLFYSRITLPSSP